MVRGAVALAGAVRGDHGVCRAGPAAQVACHRAALHGCYEEVLAEAVPDEGRVLERIEPRQRRHLGRAKALEGVQVLDMDATRLRRVHRLEADRPEAIADMVNLTRERLGVAA